jgi:aminoglycoside 3-N-acetyltransferase
MKPRDDMQLTKEQLVKDFRRIGLGKGDHVAVTLSFKSIGYLEGGPNAFIDALLETVGSQGTVMMNTFTANFPITAISSDFVFDKPVSMPDTGLVPTVFLSRSETVRSSHPTFSVAAAGKLAHYLTEGHDWNSNPYLPYERLGDVTGKYLCIGLGNRLVALRHEAQRRAGLAVIPKIRGVLYKNDDGKICLFTFSHPTCAKNTAKIVPRLIAKGIVKKGKIGKAVSLIAPSKDLMQEMSFILRQDPRLNLCNDILCWECRELERRLNLRVRVNVPLFVQRNWVVRRFVDLRSSVILKQYDVKYFFSLGEMGRIWQNLKYVFFFDFLNLIQRFSFSRLFKLVQNPRKLVRISLRRTLG